MATINNTDNKDYTVAAWRRQTHQDYLAYVQNVVWKFVKERETEHSDTKVAVKDDPFVSLPPEILFHVLSYLGLHELCISRRVSKTYQAIINSYLKHIQKLDCVPYEPVLTADGLKSVVSHVRNLRELNLDLCWVSVTEENLLTIARNCPKLRTLNTSRCKGVSDTFLQHLAVMCEDLENLNLSSCFQISDEGLVPVAEKCLKLRDLCVSSSYGVTDISVESLAKNCELLEDLDVSWCYKVSDKSLGEFLSLGKNLKLLRVSGTQVSFNMIARLSNKHITVNSSF